MVRKPKRVLARESGRKDFWHKAFAAVFFAAFCLAVAVTGYGNSETVFAAQDRTETGTKEGAENPADKGGTNPGKMPDTTPPTLNAAVTDGKISIEAKDDKSGIGSITVNGYKFTNVAGGKLTIRLEKFDAGYADFLITATDGAGNESEVYKVTNPYHMEQSQDGSSTDDSKNPSKYLPDSAKPTEPGSAAADVTEHYLHGESTEETAYSKEFYTIRTASEKIFYLIIDRTQGEEKVYFLTEISENDLLNVTENNSETLPKNSAALENGIPVRDNALPDGTGGGQAPVQEKPGETSGSTGGAEHNEPGEKEPTKENTLAGYIVMGAVAVIAIAGGYYFKVVKPKKERLADENEADDGDSEEYAGDVAEDAEEGFFEKNDTEEERA